MSALTVENVRPDGSKCPPWIPDLSALALRLLGFRGDIAMSALTMGFSERRYIQGRCCCSGATMMR